MVFIFAHPFRHIRSFYNMLFRISHCHYYIILSFWTHPVFLLLWRNDDDDGEKKTGHKQTNKNSNNQSGTVVAATPALFIHEISPHLELKERRSVSSKYRYHFKLVCEKCIKKSFQNVLCSTRCSPHCSLAPLFVSLSRSFIFYAKLSPKKLPTFFGKKFISTT